MPVTIRDVARRAGVSTSTVSRVFTAPDLVSPDSKELVTAAAAELGYRPNRAARSLVTGKTGNLGIIVPDLSNPFFPSVLQGAQARAREEDHAIFLADSGEDPRLEAELIRAMVKQVDGVILCSSRASTADLQALAGETELVLLNRRYVGLPSVLMDSAGGMRQAVEHLTALGHRRIAYLSGPRTSWSNRERRRGLTATVRGRERETGTDVVELGPLIPTFDAGYQAADLALAAGVTAVIAFNDLMALGVISRLNDRGVAVPGEMSVVGFDDIPMAAMCTPPLTSVAMPTAPAGRACVDLLLQSLGPGGRASADSRSSRRLPTQLIVRGSTAPTQTTAGHAGGDGTTSGTTSGTTPGTTTGTTRAATAEERGTRA